MTDLPGLYTAGELMFLDPSQTRFGAGETGVGYKVDKTCVESHPGQFAPWRIFSCKPGGVFDGTIFRLPLRTKAHVRSSHGEGISQRPFSLSDADELLKKFAESLPELVLFLQCVHTVEVYEWRSNDAAAKLLWELSTSARPEATPRAYLRRLLAGNPPLKRVGEHHFSHHLDVKLSAARGDDDDKYVWIVAQIFGGGRCEIRPLCPPLSHKV